MDALSTTSSTVTTTVSANTLPFSTATHTAPPSTPSFQSSLFNPEDSATNHNPPSPTATHSTKRKEVYAVSATSCSNCGTTKTPLWRRAPNGDTICNACGLYYKARNQFRPPTLKRNSARKDDQTQQNDCGGGPEVGTCPGGGHCNGSGGSESCAGCPAFNQHQVNRQTLICVNCRTRNTPLWRRDEAGNTICNACGLYYKLHNMHRPVSMKRTVIKRRKRVVVAETGEEEEVSGGESSKNENDSQQDQLPYHHHHHHHHQQQKNHQPERNPGKRIKGLKAPTQKKEEVPAIEDYILPKRLPPPTTAPSVSPPSASSISSPTSPPNIVAPRPRLPLPQMDRIYNNHNSNNNNTTHNEHPPYLPPITSTSSSSPPLSHSSSSSSSDFHHQQHQQHHQHHQNHNHVHHHHQQQHRGIDSLLQAAADCERLPPISLPPPQPSSSAPLAEFDAALNRLNQLRSRVTSQRDVYALSQLAPSLNDLVHRAEASL